MQDRYKSRTLEKGGILGKLARGCRLGSRCDRQRADEGKPSPEIPIITVADPTIPDQVDLLAHCHKNSIKVGSRLANPPTMLCLANSILGFRKYGCRRQMRPNSNSNRRYFEHIRRSPCEADQGAVTEAGCHPWDSVSEPNETPPPLY